MSIDCDDATAQEWLREVWENSSTALQKFLQIAWRYGLGFRLGPNTDCAHILGWRITESMPSQVTVEADSRTLSATNAVSVGGGQLRWRTVVSYKNPIGRLFWLPTRVIHQWLVPRLMSRAVHRRAAR